MQFRCVTGVLARQEPHEFLQAGHVIKHKLVLPIVKNMLPPGLLLFCLLSQAIHQAESGIPVLQVESESGYRNRANVATAAGLCKSFGLLKFFSGFYFRIQVEAT